jgi:hypothetical protein
VSDAIINPLTNHEVSGPVAKNIRALRDARSLARKDARSGHPGRRAQGRRARSQAAAAIWDQYGKDLNS